MSEIGGGFFTTWPWRLDERESKRRDKTPSGATRNEVEQQELEVWKKVSNPA